MTSMYPGHGKPDKHRENPQGRPGPIDYNRSASSRKAAVSESGAGDQWPKPLQWAYYILMLACVLMLVASFMGFFGTGNPAEKPTEVSEGWQYFSRNKAYVAGANLIGAIVIGVLSPQLAQRSRISRRILVAAIALLAFVNIAAVLIGVGGLFLLLIVVLTVSAGLMMYRPASNRFIRAKDVEA